MIAIVKDPKKKTFGDLTEHTGLWQFVGIDIFWLFIIMLWIPSLENRSKAARKEILWMDIGMYTRSWVSKGTNHKYKHLIMKPQESYLNTWKNNYEQLAPPHMHRINLAKRDICTFKEQFKALQKECDPNITKHLWCWLSTQARITLSLLLQARLHPHLSSYHAIWGAFD